MSFAKASAMVLKRPRFKSSLGPIHVASYVASKTYPDVLYVEATYLRMIFQVIPSVRMDEHAQRSMVHHQPREERSELQGCQKVDLEHRHRVRSSWLHDGSTCY